MSRHSHPDRLFNENGIISFLLKKSTVTSFQWRIQDFMGASIPRGAPIYYCRPQRKVMFSQVSACPQGGGAQRPQYGHPVAAIAAVSTHPTGMHSCFGQFSRFESLVRILLECILVLANFRVLRVCNGV